MQAFCQDEVWQMLAYCFICHTEVNFVWQTGVAVPSLPHEKYWPSWRLEWQIHVQTFCQDEVWQMLGLLPHLPHKFQRRVANSSYSARFATREVLSQLKTGCQLLIFVANVRIMLHLPHKIQRCVANRCSKAKFATQEVLAQLKTGVANPRAGFLPR